MLNQEIVRPNCSKILIHEPIARPGAPVVVEAIPEAGLRGIADLLELWQKEKSWIDTQLLSHGAILFRGFGVSDQKSFEQFTSLHLNQVLDYAGGNSPRTSLGKGVYTSTEYPPEYFISLHNELSYSAIWPRRLFFCCLIAADEGGETPLVDGRVLLKALPGELVEEFRRKQICYIRNLHGGKGYGPSWQKTFETEDRQKVEGYLRDSGAHLTWRADGSIKIAQVRPATAIHPGTGEEVWFNQADQFHPSTHPESVYKVMRSLYKDREDYLPQNATYGDGSPIPVEYLQMIRRTVRDHLALFPWKPGDILAVDNMLLLHGRMPFKGPRRIVVSMSSV